MVFIERLKELREARGMSQQALAMKLNLSQSTVSFYETGERSADVETLIDIAELFDVSIDFLVGHSDVKNLVDFEKISAIEVNILHDIKQLNKNEQLQVSAFIKGLLTK